VCDSLDDREEPAQRVARRSLTPAEAGVSRGAARVAAAVQARRATGASKTLALLPERKRRPVSFEDREVVPGQVR
jgi:hypothetical protein